MVDADSEDEFQRFLQEEDESSMSTSPVRTTNGKARAKTSAPSSSSAAAIASATTALLGASKLKGKAGKGSKASKSLGTKKSKLRRKEALSDSEEPPPSYDAAHTGFADEADPYAFDLRAPAFPLGDSETEERGLAKKTREKKKDSKTKVDSSKAQPRIAVPIEDRVAAILKRTGSSIIPAGLDENEVSNAEPVPVSDQDVQHGANEEPLVSDGATLQGGQEESGSPGKSSASDSLGMESADFEVGVQARRKLELSRLSLSSLNSEKFAVNVGAMEEDERPPSRYQQAQDLAFTSIGTSEYGKSEYSDKNDYGDDDFELDQTTIGDIPGLQNPNTPANTEARCTSDIIAAGPSQKVRESETFGYDEDDFEDDGDTFQDTHQVEPTAGLQQSSSLAPSELASEDNDAGYEDEGFESQGIDATSASLTVDPVSNVETESSSTPNAEPAAKLDFAALLASKYGDFYSITEEETQSAPQPVGIEAMEATGGVLTTSHLTTEEDTPMSPPPPPPPPDDDENDNDLEGFSLDDTKMDTSPHQSVADAVKLTVQDPTTAAIKDQAEEIATIKDTDKLSSSPSDHAADTAATSASSPQPTPVCETSPGRDKTALQPNQPISYASNVGDRFAQIQSHVASLRVVREPEQRHKNAAAEPLESLESASLGEIAAPTLPDFELMFDDADDVQDLIRQSQTLRAQRHSVATRQSQVKEVEMALRLQQAQRQILMLKQHIQTLASNSPERNSEGVERAALSTDEGVSGRTKGGGEESSETAEPQVRVVSETAYSKLQKEFMTQEKLIEAFQRENEKLMQQLKHAQQSANYDAHAENEVLRRQLTEAKQRLEISGFDATGQVEPGDKNRQLRAAVDGRLYAEAQALSLQEELAAARESHRQKQNELRLELDRVKKAKVELECRYEGVDLVKVAHESKQVQLLQKELALKKKEYEHNLVSLQKKLDWYIENQRLLDEQDGDLRRLKQEVTSLRSEIELLRSSHRQHDVTSSMSAKPSPSPAKMQQKSPFRRSPADIRRIQELEARLVEMETAMRKRHPDSLVNLILASRKADEESKVAVMEAAFEDKIKAMEQELEAMHESHEKKMKSFRQQQDRLLLQYQRKIRDQDIRLMERNAPVTRNTRRHTPKHGGAASDGNVDEAERVRRFYTDKMREVERRWEAKYQSLKKQRHSATSQEPGYQKKEAISNEEHQDEEDPAAVVAALQQKLHKLTDENTDLQAALRRQNPASARNNLAHRDDDDHPIEWREQIDELEKQLQASEDARKHLVKTLVTIQSVSDLPRNTDHPPDLTQIRAEVRRELLDEYRRDMDSAVARLERQLAGANEQLRARTADAEVARERMEQQAEHLTSEKHELQLQLKQSESLSEKLEEAATRVAKLEHEVLTWRRRASVPQTPSMLQYRGLELKIETLAQKHEMREAELRVLLEQAMMSSHLERLSRERVHRAAIAAKNAEISAFKQQLGEILEELALLQPVAASAPSPASSLERVAKQKASMTALSSPSPSSPPSSSKYPHTPSRYW